MSTLKTNNIEHLDAATPSIQTTIGGGVVFAGLSTFQGNAQFDGNVNIAGTVTYDDVTNIDSVGIVTAQSGLNVGPKTGIACTISSAGAITAAGKLTVGAGLAQGSKPIEVNTLDGFDRFVVSGGGTVTATGDLIAAGALLRSTSTSDGPVLQFDGAGPNGTNYIFGKIEGNNTGSNNAGELRFYTNLASAGGLSQRMLITREGKVGIGTDNISAKLQIKASGTSSGLTLLTTDGVNNNIFWVKDGGAGGFHYYPFAINRDSGDDIPSSTYFYVHGTSPFIIKSNGRVGVGITNPEKELEVSGSSSPTIRINNSDGSISANQTIGAIEFKANDGSGDGSQVTGSIESIAQATFTGQGSPSGLIFKTNGLSGPNALKERVRIDYGGNVGINTIPTQQKLTIDVDSSGTAQASFDGINICNTDTTANNGSAIIFGQSNGGNSNARIGVINSDRSGGSEDQDIFFGTLGAGSYDERMRVTGIGTVVIGDVDYTLDGRMGPCKLGMSFGNSIGNYMDVGGTSRTNNGLSKIWTFRHGYWGGSQEVASIAVETGSSSGGAGSGFASIIFNTGGSGNGDGGSTSTEKLKIDPNGRLFSVPTYNNTTANAANMSVPNSDGQFYRSTSSIKYKDNVTTLTDTLADKILECRPVSYTSKCESDDKTKINYGLIAEEVNAIDPSLVFLDEGEPEGVQYDRFVPHLINLVKRLEKRLTDAGL